MWETDVGVRCESPVWESDVKVRCGSLVQEAGVRVGWVVFGSSALTPVDNNDIAQ
jgi:hypothetical protein